MSQKKIYLLSFLLFLVAIIIYLIRNYTETVSQNQTAIEIKAVDLYSHFENNELIGDSLYKEKILIVTGKIAEVSKNNEGEFEVLLQTNNELGYVACSVENSSPNQALLTESKMVTIKGKCDGLMMDVLLTHCTVMK